MYNCAKDILAFHDEKVTLLQPQRNEMREHRDANRKRLSDRLKAADKPLPHVFIKQGSYAMLTMVQDPSNDYDVDDGAYFTQASLKQSDGIDMPAAKARQMVCDALDDGRFSKPPKSKKACVRVFYEEGYHVDIPVYRIRESDHEYELAHGDAWVVSRAADVESWFDNANQNKSPDEDNGRQLRRVVRMIKKFARSRDDWKALIAPGFTITKLAEECYVANKDREDMALRETMRGIHNRLLNSLEVRHPVTPGAMLTSGPEDKETKYLREKLHLALADIAILDNPNCSREQALSAWDKAFNTDFFSKRSELKTSATEKNVTILSNLLAARENPRAVDKHGGGRFA